MPMRPLAYSCCFLAALAFVSPCRAGAKVSVKTTSFAISGASGETILNELERKGPKHGFMSRAIAQTRYTMNSEALAWRHDKGVCIVTKPSVRLDITYIYPKVNGGMSGEMRSRWQRFMAGVTKHEETHGRLAREMAHAVDKAISGLRVKDGKGCGKLHTEMKRVVNLVVADYEARQRRFDAVEHKSGGNIEGLIRKLVK
jgi:predicted secreted Zn-dependent protease